MDYQLNELSCTARLLGYIVDTYEGYAASYERVNKKINPYPPYKISGKRHRGRYLIKVRINLRNSEDSMEN